jgi:hypothetical protein
MPITKVTQDGAVYARQDHGDGRVVVEKMDPRVVHDAPGGVASGTSLDVKFTMIDFDGAIRSDCGGTLLLDVAGTAVSLPISDGTATLQLDLFASVLIVQQAPYFCDARMEPFQIEVMS